jgi:hypothetical protein
MRQFRQTRDKAIQSSRSRVWSCGRPGARFIAVSCCRSARFSKTNSDARAAHALTPAHGRSRSAAPACVVAGVGAKINGNEFWRGPGWAKGIGRAVSCILATRSCASTHYADAVT